MNNEGKEVKEAQAKNNHFKSLLNILNSTSAKISVGLTIVIIMMAIALYYTITMTNKTPTFAVLDAQKAIEDLVTPELRDVRYKAQAQKIVVEGRKRVEAWIDNRLPSVCPSPCIVFNKEDVVIGDVINLNKKMEMEMESNKK